MQTVPAIDLQARQAELIDQIYSLRFRVHRETATRPEVRLLAELEAEFAENNIVLKRREQRRKASIKKGA